VATFLGKNKEDLTIEEKTEWLKKSDREVLELIE